MLLMTDRTVTRLLIDLIKQGMLCSVNTEVKGIDWLTHTLHVGSWSGGDGGGGGSNVVKSIVKLIKSSISFNLMETQPSQ